MGKQRVVVREEVLISGNAAGGGCAPWALGRAAG